MLRMHPDKDFVTYLCSGLRHGFDTLIQSAPLPNKECRNLLTARKSPSDVQELIEKECQQGFFIWPF